MESLAKNVNTIAQNIKDAVTLLADKIPSLENLVARHDDETDFSTSAPLAE